MLKKSRGGCAFCKAKKVKCDEKRPACSRCVNRGWTCPGYQQPLKWSLKYERNRSCTKRVASGSPSESPVSWRSEPWEDSIALEMAVDAPPTSNATGLVCHESQLDVLTDEIQMASGMSRHTSTNLVPRPRLSIPSPLFKDSVLLIDCYSRSLSRILSVYDGPLSPFHPIALSSWRKSPLLFSVLRFLAGVYQSSLTEDRHLSICVNEARIGTLGQLSHSVSAINSALPARRAEVLLVIIMFGLSCSWYDLDDLGLEHYNAAASMLETDLEQNGMLAQNLQFFQESLVYWWMILSFACDPVYQKIQDPPILRRATGGRRIPHPLTGVSPESQLLLGMVGCLVFSERRKSLQQCLTTTENRRWSRSNMEKARGLESQLLSLEIPKANMILDPEDPHTPIRDLINIADAYRLCGLLLLYHAYPDLLDIRLRCETPNDAKALQNDAAEARQQWLTSLALRILKVLEGNSNTSGTRTIEAILLVIVSGELSEDGITSSPRDQGGRYGEGRNLSTTDIPQRRTDPKISPALAEARSTVMHRFDRAHAILPFKTIDRMKTIVLYMWESMDRGSHVFWVDLIMQNKWQFLMI